MIKDGDRAQTLFDGVHEFEPLEREREEEVGAGDEGFLSEEGVVSGPAGQGDHGFFIVVLETGDQVQRLFQAVPVKEVPGREEDIVEDQNEDIEIVAPDDLQYLVGVGSRLESELVAVAVLFFDTRRDDRPDIILVIADEYLYIRFIVSVLHPSVLYQTAPLKPAL